MNTKKIKIVYLINDLILGGAQMVVLNIAKNLDPDKFSIEVCYLKDISNVLPGEKDIVQQFIDNGLSVKCLHFRNKFGWREIKAAYNYFQESRPDVLHCHMPFAVIVGAYVGRLAGIKNIIAHDHNLRHFHDAKINLLLRLASPLIRLNICYSEAVEKSIFGRVNLLQADSSIAGLKSATVLNGVDCQAINEIKNNLDRDRKRRELGLTVQDMVIVGVGRLISWKGQKNLIKVFSRLAGHYPDLRLLIVGWGSMAEELKRDIINLNLSDKAQILGSRQDTYEILVQADIFSAVYTYQSQTKETGESLGIAALEAMAAGLPILAVKNSTALKFVKDGENGILVPSDDLEALEDSLKKLIDNPDLRRKLGSAASQFIGSNYSWQKLGLTYQSIYKQCVS